MIVHELNRSFLQTVQRVLAPIGLDWRDWILNTAILRRESKQTCTITLRTSATLFRGMEYPSETGFDENVKSLDALIPLDESYAGLCFRTRAVVWVDNLHALPDNDPLREIYRSFRYVGVAARSPISEVVFPIGAKDGLHEMFLGVLNLEWCPNELEGDIRTAVNPLTSHKRVLITSLRSVIDLHSHFLLLGEAIGEMLPNVHSDTMLPDIGNPLCACHRAALMRCEDKLRRDTEAYTGGVPDRAGADTRE